MCTQIDPYESLSLSISVCHWVSWLSSNLRVRWHSNKIGSKFSPTWSNMISHKSGVNCWRQVRHCDNISSNLQQKKTPILISNVSQPWAQSSYYLKIQYYNFLYDTAVYLCCVLSTSWDKLSLSSLDACEESLDSWVIGVIVNLFCGTCLVSTPACFYKQIDTIKTKVIIISVILNENFHLEVPGMTHTRKY